MTLAPQRRVLDEESSDSPVPPLTVTLKGSSPASATEAVRKPCICRHGKQAHRHYRRGSDCALCDCGSYARPSLLGRLTGR